MRLFVLVFMITLLPLRGWAADGMATQMASTAITIESGAARAHETRATAVFDHKNQAVKTAQAMPDCHEQTTGHAEADPNASNDPCGTCQACQACHTVALSPSPLDVTISFTSPQLRAPYAAAYTSAAAALGQKPPIS
jgi:hypothetical protein